MKKYLLLLGSVVLFSFHYKNSGKMENQYPVFFAKQITVSIHRPANEVYDFASNPMNLPKWARGLSRSDVKKEGDRWLMDSPMGKISVTFAPKNEFGIIDHEVTLPSGEKILNPVRILPNNKGSEAIFTLFRLPGKTDKEYQEDEAAVRADLKKLKEIMEQ